MTGEHPEPDSPFGGDPWNTLARYLADESPAGEADTVRRWLSKDPRREELVSALDRRLHGLAFQPPADLDVEAALRRVTARLDQPTVLPLAGARPEPRARQWRIIGFRAAAAIALLAGGALVWRMIVRDGGGPQVVAARDHITAVGETDSIPLPDGSLALLGPASRLTISADFATADREVDLTGQALFDVRHDQAHPFRVRAGGAVIEDLGTTFSVRIDDGDVGVAVTVGSVLVQDTGRARGPGTVLRAGDRATVDHARRTTVTRAAVTDDDLAWTRGRLVFTDAPLSQVRADLQRWYGIDLRVDSPLAGRHLSASFAGEPADQVLRAIALALGATLERRGNTAFVRAR